MNHISIDANCGKCNGACCRYPWVIDANENTTVEYKEPHVLGWAMKRRKNGACIALNVRSNRCKIYDKRPDVCRDFEAGSEQCLKARKKMCRNLYEK